MMLKACMPKTISWERIDKKDNKLEDSNIIQITQKLSCSKMLKAN